MNKIKKYFPFIVAVAVGLIAVMYYVASGRSSQDQNIRALQNSPSVQNVEFTTESEGQKTANIQCKNGQSYEIYYPPGSTNYDALANSKCEQ